ncbi:hemolysin family protein [Klenkia brasiliensis]|uniref:Hemolysin, contains CBS domains n=1 Tax=Klenkia brasiliensis TaxID=333142 RepID=A0A1G7PCT0_9ACTN|nr:hemolysin family protein [Klenkia brasiliensis]SDF84024.1 Hemolysin, contains CBS domains [Klenkia brasiliensis]
MGDWFGVLLAVVLLAANAFFVGAEFALISARRSSIEPLAEAGSRRARTTLRAMEQVSMMMAGAQLGITVCSLGLGAIGEPAVAHLLEPVFDAVGVPEGAVYPISFVLALTVVVALHVVIGEMVPKNLALAGPDRAALSLAPPLAAVVTVLKPVIVLLNALANAALRLLRVEPKDEVTSSFTRDEVAGLLDESRAGGLLDQTDHDLLTGALTLEDRDTRTVLIPREQLTVLSPADDALAVERAAAATGFSRFPVVTDGELSGYVHVKDVLVAEGEPDVRVAGIQRPLPRVDAGSDLRSTLQTMQGDRAQLAAVVDAGRVVGVVALEDILEELVGEIRDGVHR